MNRLAQLMVIEDMTSYELADALDVDFLQISMMKQGLGLTHFDLVVAVSHVLNCECGDIYPSLRQHFDSFDEEGISEEESQLRMLDPACAEALIRAGIDPDLDIWYSVIKLKSGNERRYRMSSIDKAHLAISIEGSTDNNGYFVFDADCRHVVLNKAAVSEISFKSKVSYAPFSSIESASTLTLITSTSPRPLLIEVSPDGQSSDEDFKPLSSLISTAATTGEISQFIKMEDDGDDRYINLDQMELIEIPVCLVNPGLYEIPTLTDFNSGENDLETMIPMGEA